MKKSTDKHDYGECEICNAPMEEKVIKQDFWIRDQLVVVENVPAGVCPQCGEKVVNAEVGQRIMKLLESRDRISKAPRMSVAKLRYEAEESVA